MAGLHYYDVLRPHLDLPGVAVDDAYDVPRPDPSAARPAAGAPVIHFPPEGDREEGGAHLVGQRSQTVHCNGTM